MRRTGLRGRAIVVFTALACAVGGVARGEAVSNCFETHDVDLCLRFAADSDDWRQREELAKERNLCVTALVSARGQGAFACASDLGDEPSSPEASAGLAAQLAAAVRAHKRVDADLAYQKILAATKKAGARECTQSCNAEGRAMLRVSREGAALVVGYANCVKKAESTARARSLQEHERDAYRSYMHTSVEECRRANECEALEQSGAGRCGSSPRDGTAEATPRKSGPRRSAGRP